MSRDYYELSSTDNVHSTVGGLFPEQLTLNSGFGCGEYHHLQKRYTIYYRAILTHLSERIGIFDCGHLDLVRLELQLLDRHRRIYTMAKRIIPDEMGD